MDAISLYSFAARMESLSEMMAHVRAAAFGGESPEVLRAETALEELLTNSVSYGGRTPHTQGRVWLGVHTTDQGLHLRYEDDFEAFDPLPRIDEALARSNSPIEERAIGGLGLLMVVRLADEFRYSFENGRNCMQMRFAVRAISPSA